MSLAASAVPQVGYMSRGPGTPMYVSRRNVVRPASAAAGPVVIASSKPLSEKHALHVQERALGGKLLGEMHIDHSKDEENPALLSAHGKKAKHPTLAIVRNKNPAKPKKLFADNNAEAGPGR